MPAQTDYQPVVQVQPNAELCSCTDPNCHMQHPVFVRRPAHLARSRFTAIPFIRRALFQTVNEDDDQAAQ